MQIAHAETQCQKGHVHTTARIEKSLHSAPLGPVLLTNRILAELSLKDMAARGNAATGCENLTDIEPDIIQLNAKKAA